MRFLAKASILLLATCWIASAGATAAEETPIGRRVEDFSLPDFHGQTHSLADYRGRVVVLAFLGTECPLAKSYTAKLHELANEFATQKVAFLGIDANLQDSLTEMSAFARVHGVTFPLLKDNNNVIADRLGAFARRRCFCSIATTSSAIGAASTTNSASKPAAATPNRNKPSEIWPKPFRPCSTANRFAPR